MASVSPGNSSNCISNYKRKRQRGRKKKNISARPRPLPTTARGQPSALTAALAPTFLTRRRWAHCNAAPPARTPARPPGSTRSIAGRGDRRDGQRARPLFSFRDTPPGVRPRKTASHSPRETTHGTRESEGRGYARCESMHTRTRRKGKGTG